MKKRIKKALLLLASIGVLSATAACVGCKKVESPGPQFLKGILKEIELGEGITLSHYIQYATDSGYTITVSKGDYSKDITNKKYWAPDEPGVYTVTYTVEEGEFKGTNSFELTVHVPAISWTYTLDNTIYDVGDTLLFADYIEKMNISVQSYYDWEVVMDSVSTGTGEVSLADKDSWTFTEPGGHRFKFHVESEDGQTISMSQTVNVRLFETEMKAWMEQNNVSFYNALRLENDHSILLEEGIYNRDGSTLNPRADNMYEKDMPYVVFNGEYGFNDFVVVDFTGNNMPYVLFFGDEMTNSVIYKEAASDAQNKGLVFSNGWTYGTGEPSKSWANSVNTRFCMYGPQKAYTPGEDKEGWFRDKVSGATAMSMTSILKDGPEDQYRLAIGITDGDENSFKVAIHCLNITKGIVLYSGEYKYNVDALYGSFSNDYFTGKIGLYGHFGKRTQLDKVYAIQEDTTLEHIKEEFFKMSSFNDNIVTKAQVNQTLYVADYVTPADGADYTFKTINPHGLEEEITGDTFSFKFAGWNSIQYNDGVNASVNVNIYVPNETTFEGTSAVGYNITKNAEGKYVLGAGTHNGSTTASPDTSTKSDLAYLAFDDNYGLNDYLVFDFTGNNMPYLSFFNDEVTNSIYYDSMVSTAHNKGLILANGAMTMTGVPVEAWHKEKSVNDRIQFLGPTKAGGMGTDKDGLFRENLVRGNVPVGMYLLSQEENANKQYRVIVGFTEGTTTGCTIVMYVFDLGTGREAMYVKQAFTQTFAEDAFSGGIVLYGHYAKETVLDNVYEIEENVTLEDLKEKYCKVSKFKAGAATSVYAEKTLNVSDYIQPEAGAAYTLTLIDANGTETAITGETFVINTIGQYTLRYYDGVNPSSELTLVVVEPLQFKAVYDFEDGYAPAFLHADASWSTGDGSGVVDGAFKSWGKHKYEAINIDGDYLNWAFADKFKAVTFDITVDYTYPDGSLLAGRTWMAFQIQGTNTTNYYFASGEKQTMTITRKMYDEWVQSGMAFMRILAQNQNNDNEDVVTYTIDNLKVVDSTVIDDFQSYASRAAFNQGDTAAKTSYFGFYYTGSSSSHKFNNYTTEVYDKTQQVKVMSTTFDTLISKVTDDAAIRLLAGSGCHVYYYISMDFLAYVFNMDAKVDALTYDLMPSGGNTASTYVTANIPITAKALVGGSLTDVKTMSYAPRQWSTMTITRAEYDQLVAAGCECLVFDVNIEGITNGSTRTEVYLDNFKFVLKENA